MNWDFRSHGTVGCLSKTQEYYKRGQSRKAFVAGPRFELTIREAPSSAHHRSPAVEVFGLASTPWFLRVICSIRSFEIAKFVLNVCPVDTSKNTSKMIGCNWSFREILLVFSNRPPKFS